MTLLDACHELDELGGGRFRHIASLRPIAFRNAGTLQRIVNDFVDGDVNFPHIVSAAPMLVYTAGDGMRRLCPTRDPAVYFEIGAPFVKPGGQWQKVSLNPFTRLAHRLLSVNANVDVSLWMAGHFCKLEFELKGGYEPPNSQVAFPIGLNGLTRSGSVLSAAGVPVMTLGKPIVYDAANKLDVRPIAFAFQTVAGQPYVIFTLPALTGMARPVVDPTLTLQPDASAGKDTFEYEAGATANWGINPTLFVWASAGFNARSQLQFDVSSIPGTATVDSAVLTLVCVDGLSDSPVTHEIHLGLTEFFEGVKDGAAPDASQDGSTWNLRNANGAVAWAGGAGGGSGSDYSATVTDSGVVTTRTNTPYTYTVTTDVAAWVAGTTNNGWWILENAGTTTYKNYASSDGATASYRPKLVTDYTLALPIHRPFPILR